MNESELKILAVELSTDYSRTSLVDLSSTFWLNREITEGELRDYIEERGDTKIVIQKFEILREYAIVYFFYYKELENYVEKQREKDLRASAERELDLRQTS